MVDLGELRTGKLGNECATILWECINVFIGSRARVLPEGDLLVDEVDGSGATCICDGAESVLFALILSWSWKLHDVLHDDTVLW